MEIQKVTAFACIDLSAAFDTVNHDVLFDVMQNRFGVSGTALSWFKNYLCPRSAKVLIGEQLPNLSSRASQYHKVVSVDQYYITYVFAITLADYI